MDKESIITTVLACMDYDKENDTWYIKASGIEFMAQDLVTLSLPSVSLDEQSEATVCDRCDEEGWIRKNEGDIISHKLCTCIKAQTEN